MKKEYNVKQQNVIKLIAYLQKQEKKINGKLNKLG